MGSFCDCLATKDSSHKIGNSENKNTKIKNSSSELYQQKFNQITGQKEKFDEKKEIVESKLNIENSEKDKKEDYGEKIEKEKEENEIVESDLNNKNFEKDKKEDG